MDEIRTLKEVEFIKAVTKITMKELCENAKVKDKNFLNKNYYSVGDVHRVYLELRKKLSNAVMEYNAPDKYERACMNYEKIKETFINEIKYKKDVDIKDKKSGIYVIYIEGFDTDLMQDGLKIIPIYIGQSKNIYDRIVQHKENIRETFSLTKDVFNLRLSDKKERQYLYCKLRKCISDTRLDVENIKFKVLEYCEENELNKLERYYIDTYNAENLGFNQIQAVQDIVVCEKSGYKNVSDTLKSITNACDKYINGENEAMLGFYYFNSHMLGYNAYAFLRKIEKNIEKDGELKKLFEDCVSKWKKLNENIDIFDITDTFFIEMSLGIKSRKK